MPSRRPWERRSPGRHEKSRAASARLFVGASKAWFFEEFHNRTFSDEIVIAVTTARAETRDSSAAFFLTIDRFFEDGPDSQDLSATSLSNPKGSSSRLIRYIPPTPDGTGAKYIFYRSPDGIPLVGSGEKKLIFKTLVDGIPVAVTFDPRKLFFLGEPDF